MPFTSGYVTGTTVDPAHYKFLDALRAFAKSNGWIELMYDVTSDNRYTFLYNNGATGEEPVWIGLNTYQSVASGYYNVAVGVSNGYLPSQDYYNQPQMKRIGVPLYYDRIDYWIHVNARRVVFVCKVAQTYYEHGYMGRFIPYTSALQQPYPVFVGGMFGYDYSGENYILMTQKYSYSSYHEVPYIGSQYRSGGTYSYNGQVYSSFNNKWECCEKLALGYFGMETQGVKPVYNIDLGIIYQSSSNYQRLTAGLYGCLDGVYRICPNYNEIYAEDTITVDGITLKAFPSRNSAVGQYLIKIDD